MTDLLFERVERIKQALPDRALPGLVAVFSRARSDELLLMYMAEPPSPLPPGSVAISIDELAETNLLAYDGPIIGVAGLDVLRWDIPTKGPDFHRFDRMLRHRRLLPLLHDTAAAVAEYVREHLDAIAHDADEATRDRAVAAVAANSAGRKIARLSPARRRGMVAFVPARDHVVRLEAASLDALSGLDLAPSDKIVALDEVRPLLESLTPAAPDRYPVELRTVLTRNQLDDDLPETLRTLALAFHRRWERSGSPDDGARGCAIALEVQLARGDVDDLCAVVPDDDFEAFLWHGAGTYVYRRPLEWRGDRSNGAVRRLSLDEAREELSAGAWSCAYSLLPLRALLSSARPTGVPVGRWFDLGPVLRRIGRSEILARNAWLLVQDLLELPRDRRGELRVSLEALLDTMVHCCAIFSLIDPWQARQGRRDGWLLDAYRTLESVLDTLVRTTDGIRRSYYTALGHWYGCALRDGGVEEALDAMVAGLATIDARSARDDVETAVAEQAELLERLGAALLDVLRGGGRAEAYATDYKELFRPTQDTVPQAVARATEMAQPLDVLSEPFWASFQRYAAIVDGARKTRAAHIPVQVKIDLLTDSANQLHQARRLIFAHRHQARILDGLYGGAIAETNRWVERLQGEALLDVELTTRMVAPHVDDGIIFAVTNMGHAEARDVEVELVASEDFELVDQSFKQTLPRLGPEEEAAVRFSIRAVTGQQVFSVRCVVSFTGPRGTRQQQTVRSDVGVAHLDSRRFRQHSNPYVFGLPLQEHRRFYGRRTELGSLLSHLAERRPQNVLLRGARRTGKTSLLYMVRSVLTDTAGRAGVRRWFDISETWDEALDLAVPVMLDLQAIAWPAGGPTPTAFFQVVLGRLRDAGFRGRRGERLLAEPSVTSTQLVPALEELLREAPGQRPVVLIDEFDILDQLADRSHFYGHLRHVISTVQGMTWVVASALGLYNETRAYESPLFNVFKLIGLNRLEPDAARRLIRSPWQLEDDRDGLERPRLQFMDDAVEAILEEAGRYPYFIQLLCSEIVDHANTSRTNHVLRSTVYQVIERRILAEDSAAHDNFAYLWDRAGGTGKLILVTLLRHPGAMPLEELRQAVVRQLGGRGVGATAGGPPSRLPADFDQSLERLSVVDAVRRTRGGYVFGIPLFRRLLLKRGERENLEEAAHQALTEELAEGPGTERRLG